MRALLLALCLLPACCPPSDDCRRVSQSIDVALTRIGPCDVVTVCPEVFRDVDRCVGEIDAALSCDKLQGAAVIECGLTEE
jgi:hypothetical protein